MITAPSIAAIVRAASERALSRSAPDRTSRSARSACHSLTASPAACAASGTSARPRIAATIGHPACISVACSCVFHASMKVWTALAGSSPSSADSEHRGQTLTCDASGLGNEFGFAAREIQVDGSSREAAVLQQRVDPGPCDPTPSDQSRHTGDEHISRRHALHYTDRSTSVSAERAEHISSAEIRHDEHP